MDNEAETVCKLQQREQLCVNVMAAQPAGDDCNKEVLSSRASNSAAASTRTVDAGACLGKNLAQEVASPLDDMEHHLKRWKSG
jgi:hypothetical protein